MEVSGQLHTPAALLPAKEPLVPIRQEVGWARTYTYLRFYDKILNQTYRSQYQHQPVYQMDRSGYG